jgi:hypothetical protein
LTRERPEIAYERIANVSVAVHIDFGTRIASQKRRNLWKKAAQFRGIDPLNLGFLSAEARGIDQPKSEAGRRDAEAIREHSRIGHECNLSLILVEHSMKQLTI